MPGVLALAALAAVMLAQPRDADATIPVKKEIECLALTIYFEARGEPDIGKLAVGHVVMNRVTDPRFPGNVCEVVREGGQEVLHQCQFSWWCDGQSDEPNEATAWRESRSLARRVFRHYSGDPTSGAL
jgi:spore germination cell wall hydrolase CwlJ-like protein